MMLRLLTLSVVLASVASVALLTAGCASADRSDVAAVTTARTVPLSVVPNGVEVRAADGAVFVTDDKTNGIAMSVDLDRFSLYARIPAPEGERIGLSEIAFAPNGHLLVQRFGFGAASAVFDIAPSGQVALATDTNAARRRLGLLVLDGGTFLSSWFVKTGNAPPSGGVSLVTRGSAPRQIIERDIVTGLTKPVGLALVGDTLFISDQGANRIVKVDWQAARAANEPLEAADVFAPVEAPDLMAASPDGTLYTKCGAHGVCSFSKRGRATVLANDLDSPRGVAVDVARKRLIVVDRASAPGKASALRIVPIR